MIDLSKYPIFISNQASLKETSKDDNGVTTEYMTESQYVVINFDAVKDAYIKDLHLTQTPLSNDALFAYADGRLAFIEFKNGHLDRKEQHDVRKKIFDRLLIFSDLAGVGISRTRQDMDYILVYNESKNAAQSARDRGSVSDSPARDDIAERLLAFGGEPYVKFGLKMFKRYCFKDVFSYTEQEFEEKFVKQFAAVDNVPCRQ